MKVLAVLVSTVLLAAVSADDCSDSMTSTNGYTVSWEKEPDNTWAKFTVSVVNSASQFIAVGFSEDRLMPNTDVAVGSIDGESTWFVEDRYAFDYIIPQYDANQSLRNTSISLTNGTMTMSFIRDIISDDSNDTSINKCVYILSSWGGAVTNFTSPAQFDRHTETYVFTTQICLDQCTSGSTVLMASTVTLLLALIVGLLF